jgi:hypothetical protein
MQTVLFVPQFPRSFSLGLRERTAFQLYGFEKAGPSAAQLQSGHMSNVSPAPADLESRCGGLNVAAALSVECFEPFYVLISQSREARSNAPPPYEGVFTRALAAAEKTSARADSIVFALKTSSEMAPLTQAMALASVFVGLLLGPRAAEAQALKWNYTTIHPPHLDLTALFTSGPVTTTSTPSPQRAT